MLGLSLALVAFVQSSPIPPPGADAVRALCRDVQPVEALYNGQWYNAVTPRWPFREGVCFVTLDGMSEGTNVDITMLRHRRGSAAESAARAEVGDAPPIPTGPDAALVALLALDETTTNEAQEREIHRLAGQSYDNAYAYAVARLIRPTDDLIVQRICERDRTSDNCAEVTRHYATAVRAAFAAQDADNAAASLAAAQSRGSNEPINSNYYQSGQYSRDVAASQSGMPATASPSSAAPPVAVQSEREIREAQARCRAGSGPC